jgi:hypothetical protein
VALAGGVTCRLWAFLGHSFQRSWFVVSMIGFVVERVGDSCSGYKRPHLVVARQDCLGRGLQDPHHSTIRVMLEFFSSANYRKQRAAYFGIKAFRKRAKTFSAAGSIFRLLCSGGYGQVFFPTVRRPLLRATSWSCVKLTNTTTTNRFAYCTFPPPPHPKSHAAFRRNRAAALGPVFCRKSRRRITCLAAGGLIHGVHEPLGSAENYLVVDRPDIIAHMGLIASEDATSHHLAHFSHEQCNGSADMLAACSSLERLFCVLYRRPYLFMVGLCDKIMRDSPWYKRARVVPQTRSSPSRNRFSCENDPLNLSASILRRLLLLWPCNKGHWR